MTINAEQLDRWRVALEHAEAVLEEFRHSTIGQRVAEALSSVRDARVTLRAAWLDTVSAEALGDTKKTEDAQSRIEREAMEETLERFAPLVNFEASLSGVSTERIERIIEADHGSNRWKMIVWMYASGAWREWEKKLKEKP